MFTIQSHEKGITIKDTPYLIDVDLEDFIGRVYRIDPRGTLYISSIETNNPYTVIFGAYEAIADDLNSRYNK